MTFASIVGNIVAVINGFVVLGIALAVLYFVWGIFKYMIQLGDEKGRRESIIIITWGVLGLFVMVSLWGLIQMMIKSFGINASLSIPQF